MVPMLMVLAGLGMVVGGIVGGRLTDLWKAGATAALSHGIALCGLLLVFLLPGNHATTALLMFIIGFALFFTSSPQQLLMVQGGRRRRRADCRCRRTNRLHFGNAIGSIVGGAALDRDGDELPFHRHRRRADQPARRHPAGALHPSLRSPCLAPSQPSHPSPPNPISASIPSPPIRETDAEGGPQRRFGGNRNIKPTAGGTLSVGLAERCGETDGFPTYPQVDCGGHYCDFPRFRIVLRHGSIDRRRRNCDRSADSP